MTLLSFSVSAWQKSNRHFQCCCHHRHFCIDAHCSSAFWISAAVADYYSSLVSEIATAYTEGVVLLLSQVAYLCCRRSLHYVIVVAEILVPTHKVTGMQVPNVFTQLIGITLNSSDKLTRLPIRHTTSATFIHVISTYDMTHIYVDRFLLHCIEVEACAFS